MPGPGERTQDRGRLGRWSGRSCIQLGGSLPGPSVNSGPRALPRKLEGSPGYAGVKPEKPAPQPRDPRVWGPGLFWLHIVCTAPRSWELLPGGSVVKVPSTKEETKLPSLGWEDPLEKEMATHSSILAWRIPWTEELGERPSIGSQKSWTRLSD